MNINKQLRNLYQKNWDNFIESGKKLKSPTPTNPLLIQVDEDVFNKSDIKVMIYGQETWGWHEFSTPIEEGMDRYKKFFIGPLADLGMAYVT
jgi:hypothetical protein